MFSDPLRDIHNLAHLRDAARRVLPRGVFEFVDRGTEDEVALRNNREAIERIRFKPRVLIDVSKRTQRVNLFGKECAQPLAVAPTGAAGLLCYNGEVEIARAAARADIPFTLSTYSINAMEQVMAQAGGRLWFQLYMWPDREMSRQLVQRARSVGFEALIVTVDTATGPNREYNQRNGFALPFRVNRRNVFDLATHPGWLLRVMGRYLLNSGMPTLENLPDALRQSLTASVKTRRSLPLADSLTWDDLRELRRMWDGPLMVKGILDADDARLAVDCGADGVIVSNHGGRNLDSAIAPIDALPEVADAVGHRAHVFMDSGVRRGSDIAKALALGARAVFAGRAPLWGVAVAGEQGAARAISILHDELDRVMAYLGCPTPGALSSSLIRSDRHFFTPPSRPLHS
jgi:isopentenyl diphosphate isomerase/L-lactate dehydrogenase-like FMN-dependent dehydrogenase